MTRDEALKKMQAVKSYMTSGNPIWSVTEIGEAFDMAIEALEQPERKTGRWLISEGACEPDYMECSRCKWITEYYGGLEEEWGYCPNCGARMVRGEEHEG